MNEVAVLVSFGAGALFGGMFNFQFVRDLRQSNMVLRQRLEVVEQKLQLLRDENLKLRDVNNRLEVSLEQLLSRIGALESQIADMKGE